MITAVNDLEGPSDLSPVANLVYELYRHQLNNSNLIIIWSPPRRAKKQLIYSLIFLNNLNIRPIIIFPVKNPPSWIWKSNFINLVEEVHYLKPNMKIESLIRKIIK